MAGGFIQLLTSGKESEYLNDVPHISFFKCYFRRHTNFFINNIEIFSNYYVNNEFNTIKIPKSGDLLSKGYLKLNFNENYIELFNNYDNLDSTLTTNITNFYDSYNIYINQYNKNDISNIQICKFIFINNDIKYLNIMNTYIPNDRDLIFKIKFEPNIKFQLDQTHVFYNINLPYLYYAFTYDVNYNIVLNSINESYNIYNLFTTNINFSTLRYLRLDLANLNIAFKFTFDNHELYQYLLNYSIQNIDQTSSSNIIKINQYDIYLSLNFNLNNQNGIDLLIQTVNVIKNLFSEYNSIYVRYYNNKIKYTDIVIKSIEFNKFVNNMFGKEYNNIVQFVQNNLNNQNNINNEFIQSRQSKTKHNTDYTYYNIIFPSKILLDYAENVLNNSKYEKNPNHIQMDIFNLKNSIFFGNLDTNDFNETLINNESSLINSSNINSPFSVSSNTYIRLLVKLFCDNSYNSTIQEFLKIVNNPTKINNFFISNYAQNINKFNKIILDTLIFNNVLFLNQESIRSLVYQNETFEHYNKTITQFISKKISTYENTIINNYIFKNILGNINSNYYCAFDMVRILIQSIIIANYTLLNSSQITTLNYYYDNTLNYENNNNVFDLLTFDLLTNIKNNQQSKKFAAVDIIYRNLESFMYYTIYLSKLLINSNIVIENIYNKNSEFIYSASGLNQQVIIENPLNNVIFPLTSNFFFYTQNTINNSNNKNNYNLFTNIDKNTYDKNIKKTINQLYIASFKKYNTNLNNAPPDFSDSYDLYNGLYVESIINNYYTKIQNYLTSSSYSTINNFFNTINNYNSQLIYNTTTNVDFLLLLGIFEYTDNTLFNGAFSNYDITYPSTNNFYFINENTNNYLKFIFLPSSPYYRIYYLYNFLATMSTDTQLLNQMPNDLIQLRDLLLQILINIIINNLPENILSKFSQYTNYTFSNFNIEIMLTFNIFINNVFMCYDDINVLFNDNIKNIFSNNEFMKEIYIYCPFYFNKNNVNLIQNSTNSNNLNLDGVFATNGFNILNLLANLYNNVKYNFDDTFINALLITIKFNQNFFVNVNDVINFVEIFLSKNNNNFTSCINSLNSIILSNNQYNNNNTLYNPIEFTTNTTYNNCYYTSYSVGVLFDNMNKIIIDTINSLYSITNQLTNIELFSTFYKNKTFDIKQFQNSLSSSQISEGFIFYKKLLFDVDISMGVNALLYYQNIINGITKYIFDNFSYLINYLVSDFVFKDLLLTIDNYAKIYNIKNNSNIDLYNYFNTLFNININRHNTNNKFQTNNIIVIYLLYFLFIVTCLSSDITNFTNLTTNHINSQNDVYNRQTFNIYIQSLYTENIYLNCLESFITIINNSTEILIFNYSTIYIQNIANGLNINNKNLYAYSQPSLFNIIFNTNINFNNTNFYENKLINYDESTDYTLLTSKVFTNQYNINDVVSWYQLNINYSVSLSIKYLTTKQLSYNIPFYNRYRNTINSILNENEKLLFTINNKYFVNFISNNKLVSNDLFTTCQTYVQTIYEDNLSIIKNMYNNLNFSFQSNGLNYYGEYQNLIINQIFNIIKNFYDTTINNSNTYTHTILFSNTNKLKINNIQINSLINNNLYDITTYDSVVQDFVYLRDFLIRYLNLRITSSINIERNINRFIYNYVNQYVLKTNNNSQYIYKYINNNSSYDYIKLYNNIYSKSSIVKYETNLALYQNDIVFEILNYLNYTDKKTFIQNSIFNDFIVNFSLESHDCNSFYSNFKHFVNFLNLNKMEKLFNKLKLLNGTNVIDFFLDLFNLEEFHNYIYEFINLTESFSPISIYDDIIHLQTNFVNNNLNSKITIDFDNIIKKIVIYLFIIYLINANLFNIINSNIISKILKNYTLEYNFPQKQIKVNLVNVFDDFFYTKLKKYIYYITVFDPNYPSIYNTCPDNFACGHKHHTNDKNKAHCNINMLHFDSDFYNSSFFYDIKYNTNAKDYLNLCYKFVSSYKYTIGFNNINTTSLILYSSLTDMSISHLVQNYNIMLNIDQSINNPNNYYMTNATSIILNTNYSTNITDINNISNHEEIFSQFTLNNNKYFTCTQIKNVNLLFILLVYLLGNLNIIYPEQINNLNNILANFRIGTFNISEIFEEFKGYTSDNYIKNNTINLVPTKQLTTSDNNNRLAQNSAIILSRSQNITDLSFLISETQNYSNTIPIDYDFDVINISMGSIYNKGIDIYKKYYSYQYNFYKFENNYTQIYFTKNKYYLNIINSDYSLLNIKNYSNGFFNKVFIDIIYTLLAQPFFNYKGNNTIFESGLNQLIKLYMKYYFTFKSNSQISNTENLKIQKSLRTVANTTMTIKIFNNFINELYFYELYGIPYTTIQTGTVIDNFNYFIQQLEFEGNYNFEYINSVYNFVFNLENTIILINWYLKKNFSIDTENNFIVVKKFINDFIEEISSFSNISQYFKNSYLYYQSSINPFIYNYVVNTVNYTDFINKFSAAVTQIIYNTQNISISNAITQVYNTYFKNITFYYKNYVENNFIITPYTININQMQQYIYSYLNFILSNNKNNNNNLKILTIYKKIINLTLSTINIDMLNILYEWIFKKENSNLTTDEYIQKFEINLYDMLVMNYWGIIYSYYDNYYFNKELDFKILLINYGTMIVYNPHLTIEYIYNTNYKLEILYRFKLFYIMINNLSNSTFQNYFLYVLTNANQYIFNDNLFYCLNLENDVSVYLDFLNSNIIEKNLISNYYKNIQNNTIKQIINYKINTFYNYDVNLDFLLNIYNSITVILVQQDETSITNVFLDNTIINILNQYNNINIYNYTILQSNNQYIEKVFETIINNISVYLTIIKNIFGGTDKNQTGIRVSVNQLLNIFSNNNNYMYNNNTITIFTLIYDNFNNLGVERINYNMLITLFYYICMIIYVLNKWDIILNQYFFDNSKALIYILINYINIQIYNYINAIHLESTNKFFDGLNELLFYTYDNQTFTKKIINFFDSILDIQQVYNEELITQIKHKASLKTYSGGNIIEEPNYISNMLYKKYVTNNKILIWKNMLINIVDANISQPIYNMKSLMYDTLFNIPASYLEQITTATNGLFSNYGIINLLEYLELYISDQLIDRLTSDMLIIIQKLMVNLNVLKGLDQMLGIGYTNDFIKPGLIKPYILQVYKNKSLYLPLSFFFKDAMNSIPLISCMYSDIFIKIKNSSNNLIKGFYKTTSLLLAQKTINTSTLFDFILLERTERKRLTLNKQDNLIEKHNYYTVSEKINIQLDNQENVLLVNFDFNIGGLIKEIFWTIDFFINGYLIEVQNYTTAGINDLILSTVFYINGIRRDGIYPQIAKNNNTNGKDNIINMKKYNYNNITRLLNPYRYNTRVDMDNNINTYSFAFEPEKFQPTGSINMDMYNTFRIQLVIDKNKFIEYFGYFNYISNLDTITMTLKLSTLEYNLIRYQSGLAGLLFMK